MSRPECGTSPFPLILFSVLIGIGIVTRAEQIKGKRMAWGDRAFVVTMWPTYVVIIGMEKTSRRLSDDAGLFK